MLHLFSAFLKKKLQKKLNSFCYTSSVLVWDMWGCHSPAPTNTEQIFWNARDCPCVKMSLEKISEVGDWVWGHVHWKFWWHLEMIGHRVRTSLDLCPQFLHLFACALSFPKESWYSAFFSEVIEFYTTLLVHLYVITPSSYSDLRFNEMQCSF